MNKINQLLKNEEDNHLMPFLWMHGEDEETIRHYIKKIAETGIKAVCIESRPHPDFVKEKWWHDVGIIIDESKKHNLKIWILDDSHFPTGYAAGEMKNYPELQKQFLRIKHFDFVGPRNNVGVMLEWTKIKGRPNITSDEGNVPCRTEDEILGIVAAKKTDFNKIDSSTLIDISGKIKGDTLYWDIPEGEWSVFVLISTYDGGEESTKKYLNPIVKEATEVLVNTVYESHFEHFGDEFGDTILGFFSDEPRFGNIKGPDAKLGEIEMDYPWSKDFLRLIAEKNGITESEALLQLPLLQIGEGQRTQSFRYNYMELASELYSQNFSQVLGDWCASHGVEYIGHVIEDNNAHARLGYGAGHFFKSLSGQHMSGIDVVLHQLMPDFNNGKFKSMTSTGWDGEFFTYGLAKMGASLGYLDEKKRGRTMCEVFGAYGWNEGMSLMKYIADHMLASGVNYFVPHSFTMTNYPDPDCPPHLYGHGHNPQFKYTDTLVSYMNRIATLISDGSHSSDVAVLYHGESEWAGESMLSQKPMRKLIENQIEFDVIDQDFLNRAEIKGDAFIVNDHKFKQLVIPYTERISLSFLKTIKRLIENGINVIFVDDLPLGTLNDNFQDGEIDELAGSKTTALSELAQEVKKKTKYKLSLTSEIPHLRYFHYNHETSTTILLFNESTNKKIETELILNDEENILGYDAVKNELYSLETSGNKLKLELDYGEMIVLITDNEIEFPISTTNFKNSKELEDWEITFEGFETNKEYSRLINSKLPVLGVGDEYEDFVGNIHYKAEIGINPSEAELYIDGVNEIAEVYMNGHSVGVRIGTPYKFELSPYLDNDSENILEIIVTNNLGRRNRDFLSQYLLIEPLGISGKVVLYYN